MGGGAKNGLLRAARGSVEGAPLCTSILWCSVAARGISPNRNLCRNLLINKHTQPLALRGGGGSRMWLRFMTSSEALGICVAPAPSSEEGESLPSANVDTGEELSSLQEVHRSWQTPGVFTREKDGNNSRGNCAPHNKTRLRLLSDKAGSTLEKCKRLKDKQGRGCCCF